MSERGVLNLRAKGLTTIDWYNLILNKFTDEDFAKFKIIDLSNNQLTSIPGVACFKNLCYLFVHDNQLVSLGDLSSLISLKTVVCDSNCLTFIDRLPPSLLALSCSNNLIRFIDIGLLPKLVRFDCENNQLACLFNCDYMTKLGFVNFRRNNALPHALAIFAKEPDEIEKWRIATKYHHNVRMIYRPAVVAILGVAKKKRAIRDVLGLIARMIWKMKVLA